MVIYEKISKKRVFKIKYPSTGDAFVIQILGTFQFTHYTAFSYVNPFQIFNVTYNDEKNINHRFLSFVSRVLNGSNKVNNVIKVSALLFHTISPTHLKTQRREMLLSLNPTNTLEGVFNHVSGYLFMFKGLGNYNEKKDPVIGYLGDTVELDASLKIVAPDVYCVPQLIYKNTDFPLGLIVEPTELSSLYSLFL